MSIILTKEEAKKIIDKVLAFSKADEMSVSLSGSRTGNIRYARNSVSTSGESYDQSLAVTAVFGKRSGTATINEFDDAALKKVVENGITTISTDFKAMGKTLAKMLLHSSKEQIENPSDLIIRKSL